MNKQFYFPFGPVKTFPLRTAVLIFCLLFFFSFAVPAHAAGNSGWIEAHVSVPDGFDEHIIVCFENVETGEEYAARISEINGYDAYFELPAGSYFFRRAFLENNDFRYYTSLTNGPSEFVISADADAALELNFTTTFNDSVGTVVRPTEPEPEPTVTETTSPETTEGTDTGTNISPADTSGKKDSYLSTLISAVTGKETSSETEATDAVEETEAPVSEETKPVETQSTITSSEPPVSSTGFDKMDSLEYEDEDRFTEEEETSSDLSPSEEQEGEEEADTEGGPSLLNKIIYSLIAVLIFALVVFVFAYFYRRHLEEN